MLCLHDCMEMDKLQGYNSLFPLSAKTVTKEKSANVLKTEQKLTTIFTLGAMDEILW